MSRLALVTIFFTALSFVTPWGDAQQKRAAYGPVVNAYLTGLAEELNELDFQLKHREIKRTDYDRARQRLTLLRRFVERLAARSPEDLVPELEVLADDELGSLGLNARPNPDLLQIGELLEGQWKILGIERGKRRFFVFNRIPQPERSLAESVDAPQRSGRKLDPREVVETVVVRDNTLPPPPSQPQSKATEEMEEKSLAARVVEAPEPPPRLQPPRLMHIFLPQYTTKARNKNIEGEVVVRALFQGDGKVRNVKIDKGLGYGLDQQAIEAVRQIAFFPARFDGKEIDTNVRIIFNFKPDKVTFNIKTAEISAASQTDKQ